MLPVGGIKTALLALYRGIKFVWANRRGIEQLFDRIVGFISTVVSDRNVQSQKTAFVGILNQSFDLALRFAVNLLGTNLFQKITGQLRRVRQPIEKKVRQATSKLRAPLNAAGMPHSSSRGRVWTCLR